MSLLHPDQPCFGGFGFAVFRVDIVGGDDQVVFIEQTHFGAPAPIGTAGRVGVAAEHLEAVLMAPPGAEHDGGVVVETIDPAGFVLIGGGVVAEGEHAVLGLAFDGALVQVDGEALLRAQA